MNILELFRHKKENEIHDVKNEHQAEILKIHLKARQQVKHSEELLKIIEKTRLYQIAVATGGKKRGLI